MEILAEEECLTADGFDGALVGCTYGADVVAVYDVNRMVTILVQDEEMTIDDAIEYLDYNVVNAYVGEKTPMFVVLDAYLQEKPDEKEVHDD